MILPVFPRQKCLKLPQFELESLILSQISQFNQIDQEKSPRKAIFPTMLIPSFEKITAQGDFSEPCPGKIALQGDFPSNTNFELGNRVA